MYMGEGYCKPGEQLDSFKYSNIFYTSLLQNMCKVRSNFPENSLLCVYFWLKISTITIKMLPKIWGIFKKYINQIPVCQNIFSNEISILNISLLKYICFSLTALPTKINASAMTSVGIYMWIYIQIY